MLIRKMILLIAHILLVFALAIYCNKKAKISENLPPRVAVELTNVIFEPVSIPIHTSGVLYSKEQIRLSFKTGGIVEQIFVREGQTVKEGDVLAKLDLSEISAQVQQAQSGLLKAQRDYERIKSLYADSVVTLEQKQNVETALDIAMSNAQIAEFNLKHSTIYAPENGKILRQFVETNEIVGPGTPIFYFGSGSQEWLVKVGVTDRDIVKIQLGDTAIVKFDAYPHSEFTAKVTEIAQAADPMNGTFEVEILLNSKGYKLATGFVAQIVLIPSLMENRYLVPVEALVNADGQFASVFTIKDDTARKISISTGSIIKNRMTVLSGLENIPAVVTTGAPYLNEGDLVTIK